MKIFWRAASLVFVSLMFVVLVPIDWDALDWGTVPEWIGAAALLAIAVGVWRIAVDGDRARLGSRIDWK